MVAGVTSIDWRFFPFESEPQVQGATATGCFLFAAKQRHDAIFTFHCVKCVSEHFAEEKLSTQLVE